VKIPVHRRGREHKLKLVSRELVAFWLNPPNLAEGCIGIDSTSERLPAAFQLAM